MLHLAIVDDDVTIRKDLRTMIQGALADSVVLMEAGNGAAVVNAPNLDEVDVIITDITMPKMDGIELIKRVKARYPRIEILVLSNYDDFVLVREAMRFGARDYLLKYQVTPETITRALCSLRESMEERRPETRLPEDCENRIVDRLCSDLLHGRGGFSETLDLVRKLRPGFCPGRQLSLVLAYTADGERIAQFYGHLAREGRIAFWLESDPGHWAAVVDSNDASSFVLSGQVWTLSCEIAQALEEGGQPYLVCRGAVCDGEQLAEEYKRLRSCCQNMFYLGKNHTLDAGYLKPFAPLREEELAPCAGSMEELFAKLRAEKYYPDEVRDYLRRLIRRLREERRCDESAAAAFLDALDAPFCTLPALEEAGRGLLDGGGEGAPPSGRLRRAEEILENEYMTPVTLDYVARECGYNRNYFCRLFKEEYGKGFVELLTKRRMDVAAALLRDPGRSVKEVAAVVGMDYHYFCRVFRAYHGVSPNEARRRREGREG